MRFFQFTFLLIFTSTLFAQRQEAVDFTHAEATISIISNEKKIDGFIVYDFTVLRNTDSIFLDAVSIDFKWVNLDSKRIDYNYDGKKITIKKHFGKGSKHRLILNYSCSPGQTVYFIGYDDEVEDNEQIWTQGQGKYTSHWLPSFDDMTEKVEFDLKFNRIMDNQTFISNGKIEKVISNHSGGIIQEYNMTKPMSSYLVAFAIGNFTKKELKSSTGVPIELYYERKDSLKVEPTYRHTKEIFDFLEKEINVPYPWQNYKQVPVQDFLYAGMENTGTTIFSNSYMIDSTAFVDKNYVNINAHELAHQWFGNLVTEVSSKHHWLHEGFATYYAYLAEKELFGDEHFYWKLYETARTLHNLSESGGGEALTNPNANSLTFYEKGAWALVMLRDKVGNEAFREGVKKYLIKHQFKNVTISDFLMEVETASNQNLIDFREKWLESDDFPWEEVKELLKQNSKSLALVFEMEDEFQRIKSDDLDYKRYWDRTNSSYFKQYLIKKHYRILPIEVINMAFLSKDIKVRQALASSLYGLSKTQELNAGFAANFETLLNDNSYITIENALIKLWSTFPEKRTEYFTKTDGIIGFPNKNVRLLWLTLALLTPDYNPELQQSYYNELNGYTSTHNHFEVRQLAFQYLSQIQAMSDDTLINLVKATEHHVWQFKKSSRNLLRELVENESMKKRLLNISNALTLEQKEQLNRLIRP